MAQNQDNFITDNHVLLIRIDERLHQNQKDVAELRAEMQLIKHQSASTENQLRAITDKWKAASFIILTLGAAGGWLIDTLIKIFLKG